MKMHCAEEQGPGLNIVKPFLQLHRLFVGTLARPGHSCAKPTQTPVKQLNTGVANQAAALLVIMSIC